MSMTRIIRSKKRARKLIKRGEDVREVFPPEGGRYWTWVRCAQPPTDPWAGEENEDVRDFERPGA